MIHLSAFEGAVVVTVWLFPSVWAISEKNDRVADVIVMNVLLGWFPLVWLALLIIVWEDS